MFGFVEIAINDLFEMRNGYTPLTTNKENWENGTIPWFRMEDIRLNGNILNKAIQYVNSKAIKGKCFAKDSIIVATSATIGEHALITTDFLCNQRFTCLSIKNQFKDMVDKKYLYYFAFKLDEWCKLNTTKSSFSTVDMEKFRKFKFIIPLLNTQKRIVNILDKFDLYCNDITQGIPAEIELRQKQYEYYRNMLLTFKELK